MDIVDWAALVVSLLLLAGVVVMALAAVYQVVRAVLREGSKPHPRL